jgi:2-polyprenyl-3-methyl-5-hydroxy-6-metoxy-1,4-benzoquinol methylase
LALDIPCGYGRFSKFFHEGGFSLVSSDYSYQMVGRAVERLKRDPIVLGITADAKKNLPFRSGSFDVLLSMRFFHHVHEPEEREFILREFARVSQNWIVISYYQTNFLHQLQRKFRKIFKKSQANIKMISRNELKSLLGKAGLSLVKVIPLLKGIHAQNIALISKLDHL